MRPGTKKSQVLFLLRPHTIQELFGCESRLSFYSRLAQLQCLGSGAAVDCSFRQEVRSRLHYNSFTSKRSHRGLRQRKRESGRTGTKKKQLSVIATFVTYCLDKAKSERTEHINEARRVWLVARDFLRKERSEQAVKDRKAAEAKQAAKMPRWMLSPLALLKLLPRHETSRLASRAKAMPMPQIAF